MVKIYPDTIECQYNVVYKYHLDSISANVNGADVLLRIENDDNSNSVFAGMSCDDARALARELMVAAKWAEELSKR